MTLANNTGKIYSGFRTALNLSSAIFDPYTLFDAYKSRVVADGGYIPDESGCLARFDFLLSNAMYERAAVSITPAFGIKRDEAGNVQAIYNLLGEAGDLLAVTSGTPAEPMLYDEITQSVNVRIVSAGGTWLQSRASIIVQRANSYLIAGRMSDLNRADNNGLTIGWPIGTLPMAYMRTMLTNNQVVTESWRFGTRDSGWPAGTGGSVLVSATIYEDFVPAAGLFDVPGGTITGYEKGKNTSEVASTTGALADLRGRAVTLVVGTPGSTNTGCHGAFKDLVHLHTADESDAILASRLGM